MTTSSTNKRKLLQPEDDELDEISNNNNPDVAMGLSRLNERDLEDSQDSITHSPKKQKIIEDSSDTGTIETVMLENFMCHSNFSCNFCPKLNFLTGQNGSGKSAILTAITVCLGGKANFTNRGNSVQSLLKNDSTNGSVSVKLCNKGFDAYRYQDYGKSIIIQRKIVRDGSSSYKIMNFQNKVISVKKEELENIKDHFNICIDNPLTILTQDTARSFLANSTTSDLYKGSMLQQISEDYNKLQSGVEEFDRRVGHLTQEIIPELKEEVEKIKDRYKDCQQHRELEDSIRIVNNQLTWARVEEEEKDIAEFKNKVLACKAKSEAHCKSYDATEEKLRETEAEITDLKGQIQFLSNDIQPKQEELTNKKKAYDELVKKRKDLQREMEDMNRSITMHRKSVEEIRLNIEHINKRNNSNYEEEVKKRMEEIKEIKEYVNSLESEKVQLQAKYKEIDKVIQEGSEQLDVLKAQEGEIVKDISLLERNIDKFKEQSTNKLSIYGDSIGKIVQQINLYDERGEWDKKPIGPMGLHISVQNDIYQTAVETLLNRMCNCFCVVSVKDQNTLNEIFKKFNSNLSSYRLSENHLPRLVEPPSHFDTVHRVDNEIVLKTLIINAKIETTILVETSKDGHDITDKGFPPNCSRVFTKDCETIGSVSGGLSTKVTRPYRGPSRLNKNIDEYISLQKKKLQSLEQKKHSLETNIKAQIRKFEKSSQAKGRIMSDIKRNANQMRAYNSKIEKLEESIHDDEPQDVIVFENSKKEKEEAIEMISAQFTILAEKIVATDEDLTTRNSELMRLTDFIKNLQSSIQEVEATLTSKDSKKNQLIEASQHYHKKMESYAAVYNEKNLELNVTVEKLRNKIIEVEFNCPRVVPTKSCEELQTERKKLLARHSEMTKVYGDSHEVYQKLEKKVAEYNKFREEVLVFSELRTLLTNTLHNRWMFFKQFRAYISGDSKQRFRSLASRRGYRGKLILDHVNAALHLFVDAAKSNEETTGKKIGGDIKSLSGGEKSFSTICLLLALWESMNVPFRALDEFDVFMDAVNRNTSMKLMIENAQEIKGKEKVQYIFISPQEMGTLKKLGTSGMKVIKMHDPERGQTTLNFNRQPT